MRHACVRAIREFVRRELGNSPLIGVPMAEERNFLRFIGVGDFEIGLGEIADGLATAIDGDHVEELHSQVGRVASKRRAGQREADCDSVSHCESSTSKESIDR